MVEHLIVGLYASTSIIINNNNEVTQTKTALTIEISLFIWSFEINHIFHFGSDRRLCKISYYLLLIPKLIALNETETKFFAVFFQINDSNVIIQGWNGRSFFFFVSKLVLVILCQCFVSVAYSRTRATWNVHYDTWQVIDDCVCDELSLILYNFCHSNIVIFFISEMM